MSLSDVGVSMEEASDRNAVHAYIATHFESTASSVGWAPTVKPISYAALIVGTNFFETIWGFGYGTYADAGSAAAMRHADEFRGKGQKLIGYGRGLVPHIGKNGTAFAAIESGLTKGGLDYDAIEVIGPLARDIHLGKTEWVSVPKRNGPSEYLKAAELAAGEPWVRAEKYRPHFSAYFEAYPRNHIIGRNDDPDPLGLFK